MTNLITQLIKDAISKQNIVKQEENLTPKALALASMRKVIETSIKKDKTSIGDKK